MSITPSPSILNLQSLDTPDDVSHYYCVKGVMLCFLWYISSAANGIMLKKCLAVFPFPLSLTVVQFFGCAALTFPLLKYQRVRGGFSLSKGLFMTGILPLSGGKVAAVFFATLSIANIPLSYSNTIKASLPLFSVIFSKIILGQSHSPKIYCSLLLIIFGVVICSFTEVLFNLAGLLSAIIGTMATALLSVYAKKAMSDHNMHYLKMLYFVSITSLFLTLPFLVLLDGTNLLSFDYSSMGDPIAEIFPLISGIALTNFTQNVAAFGFLSLVNPVSYSVANCMKRVFTIAASLAILRNPVSILNILGMVTALSGVALYNKIKLDEKKREKMSLPTVVKTKHPNPLLSTHHAAHQVHLKSHTAYVLNGYTNYSPLPPRLIIN